MKTIKKTPKKGRGGQTENGFRGPDGLRLLKHAESIAKRTHK
jgi:hypothetical protein